MADRWHLLRILADALERVVERNRAALIEAPPNDDGDFTAVVIPVEGLLADRTRQRHAKVHELAARGVGNTAICARLGLDLKTVHRYLRATSPDDLLGPRPTSLDPNKTYLAGRYPEGCTDGARAADVRPGDPGSLSPSSLGGVIADRITEFVQSQSGVSVDTVPNACEMGTSAAGLRLLRDASGMVPTPAPATA